MAIKPEDAYMESPKPKDAWLSLNKVGRIDLLSKAIVSHLPQLEKMIRITDTKDDGQVIVVLTTSLEADMRGTLLLDLEEVLKQKVDDGLTVWHEPLGDKNSLRKLRGIEVKL